VAAFSILSDSNSGGRPRRVTTLHAQYLLTVACKGSSVNVQEGHRNPVAIRSPL